MDKDVNSKNRDRLIQLGVAISTLRKMRGLSQEKLAEKQVSDVRLSVQSKHPVLQKVFQ